VKPHTFKFLVATFLVKLFDPVRGWLKQLLPAQITHFLQKLFPVVAFVEILLVPEVLKKLAEEDSEGFL
jgi:hypothetical protein